MIERLSDPVAIVRSVEEYDVERDAQYWHELAMEASSMRNLSTLKHAECLYHIDKDAGYKKLGYETLQDYVYKNFERSSQWSQKLIHIHRKLAVELDIDEKTLQECTFGKLSKIVAHINEENKDEVLTKIKGLTQQEVSDYAKELQGIVPEEDKPKEGTLRFKGPIEMIESINCALSSAREEIFKTSTFYKSEDDVPNLLQLEFIAGNFLASVSLEGDPYETLETQLKALMHNYNVDIKYIKREE